jgi:pSer/pThr/pTyr-binding forkhead associated (FHA) protein
MEKCKNGHFYNPATHSHCPYCPQPEGQNNNPNETVKTKQFDGNQGDKTEHFNTKNADPSKTDMFDKPENNHNKTQLFDNANETDVFTKDVKKTAIVNENKEQDWNKTYIGIDDDDDLPDGNQDKLRDNAPRAQRKLVGWLVSYTIDPLGIDFRLYEGKNVIGSAPDNEITVMGDKLVSSRHATILFRSNKFRLKDEFSTNGTFLNNEDIEDEVIALTDGDIIKVGATFFKFRSAL